MFFRKSTSSPSSASNLVSRKPFIAANYKCNGTLESTVQLIATLSSARLDNTDVQVVVMPSFLHIPIVKQILRKDFELGAQNCYFKTGPFSGEISAEMIKNFQGINWVMLGHSERRINFHESDALIGEKCLKCLQCGLKVVLCIGENQKEYQAGKTHQVLTNQLKTILIESKSYKYINDENLVIAYEPVWAILSGTPAPPKYVQQIHSYIRSWVRKNINAKTGDYMRIIYGGGAKPETAKQYTRLYGCFDVDGLFVGTAALDPTSFTTIINEFAKTNTKINSRL